MSLVEDALSGASVFKDESTLDFHYVPDELPHRDDAIRRLAGLFRGVAEGKTTQIVQVRGPVGSGKTALSRRFSMDLRDAVFKRGRKMRTAYVNCRNDRTPPLAMLPVLRSFDPGFPDRGFSVPEMLDALKRQMVKNECSLLVILDEVDALLRNPKGLELLYTLSRFETEGETGLSLILVSQRDITQYLDEATASSLKRTNTLELEGYGMQAMQAIVGLRVRLAFLPGAMPPHVAELVADIASRKGDARLAIELLASAGTNANDRGAEQVSAEDVRTAKATIHSELPEHKLRELPAHELYVLLAIARRLARSDESYTTTGEVQDAYSLVAEEFEDTPRGGTQFWQYLKNLEGYGFVDLRKSSKGHIGTTHLISLPDAPAAELEPWLHEIVTQQRQKAG